MEYVEYFLCKEIYHCLPEELAKQPLPKILSHLVCITAENKARKAEKNASKK